MRSIKINKTATRGMCLLFVFLAFATCVFAEETKVLNEDYNVLVIQSYHNGHKWEDHVLEGIYEAIETIEDYHIIPKVEYLDFRQNFNQSYIDQFIKMLEIKYPKGSIDAIYAVDNEAFEIIREHIMNKRSAFYEVPLLFSGVNGDIALTPEEKQYITGVYERDDTAQLLFLIKDINPKVNQINVIIERSQYGEALKQEINLQLEDHWKEEIEVNYIQTNYIEEIEEKLGAIDFGEESVVIIAGEFQYICNRVFLEPEETISRIKKYTHTPIYSNDQTYLDAGILGGCIDIGQDHGRNIITTIDKIIKGRSISDMPCILEPNASKFINYNEIYEFGINPKNVPLYSILRNKKFYQFFVSEEMQALIYCGMLGVLFMAVALAYKSIHLRHEKQKLRLQEERDKLRTDHIVTMSHEFKTPINVILSTVQLLEMKTELQNVEEDYLKDKLASIKMNSYRLTRLINNFMDLSRNDLGFLNVTKSDQDIVLLLNRMLQGTKDYATKKGIVLNFHCDEESLVTAIDREKIQRVILNLLSNAIKFTEENGHIDVYLTKVDDTVHIKIKDTGRGIPEPLLEKIFERFYQVDDVLNRHTEGSGIGLNICQNIVQLHGGEIKVESEVDAGSIFTVILPMCRCYQQSREVEAGNEVAIEMSDI